MDNVFELYIEVFNNIFNAITLAGLSRDSHPHVLGNQFARYSLLLWPVITEKNGDHCAKMSENFRSHSKIYLGGCRHRTNNLHSSFIYSLVLQSVLFNMCGWLAGSNMSVDGGGLSVDGGFVVVLLPSASHLWIIHPIADKDVASSKPMRWDPDPEEHLESIQSDFSFSAQARATLLCCAWCQTAGLPDRHSLSTSSGSAQKFWRWTWAKEKQHHDVNHEIRFG